MNADTAVKLDSKQKHLLRLTVKGKGADGWSSVSAQLFPVVKEIMPETLVELELVGNDGGGRIRLTDTGINIFNAMEWL